MLLTVTSADARILPFLQRELAPEGVAVLPAPPATAVPPREHVMLMDAPLYAAAAARGEAITTPVIQFTTCRTERLAVRARHRVGLRAPFSLGALAEALRNVGSPLFGASRTLVVGPLAYDLATGRISRDYRALDLHPQERHLLERLMRQPGITLHRAEVARWCYDYASQAGRGNVDVLVARLRHTIDRGFARPLIETVRGVGYRITLS